jgi:hypothetical protein
MAFKLAASDSFWFPVKVSQINEAGKNLEHIISFKFKRLNLDQRQERDLRAGGDVYKKLMAETDGNSDVIGGKFTAEMIRQGKLDKTSDDITDELLEIVCDWKEVKDYDDSDMVFNRENLLKLVLIVPGLPKAINDAYTNAYSGELKRGN